MFTEFLSMYRNMSEGGEEGCDCMIRKGALKCLPTAQKKLRKALNDRQQAVLTVMVYQSVPSLWAR